MAYRHNNISYHGGYKQVKENMNNFKEKIFWQFRSEIWNLTYKLSKLGENANNSNENVTDGAEFSDVLRRFVLLGDGECAGAAEDDQIEQRVGAQTVGAVHRSASSLAASVQTRHHSVNAVLVRYHLATKIQINIHAFHSFKTPF